MASATARAKEFTGWYFCAPDWHRSYALADDSEQDRIYQTSPEFLELHRDAIRRDIALLKEWFEFAEPEIFTPTKITREASAWTDNRA